MSPFILSYFFKVNAYFTFSITLIDSFELSVDSLFVDEESTTNAVSVGFTTSSTLCWLTIIPTLITNTNAIEVTTKPKEESKFESYKAKVTAKSGLNARNGASTSYAKISGYVKYERLGKDKKQVSVYETL